MPQPEEHTSPDGVLTFVVEDLEGNDVAIGFRGYASHTHADILASISGLSEDEAVRAYVDSVLADESIIAIQSIDGAVNDVWITNDPASELKYIEPNEKFEFRYWSGRQLEIG